MNFLLSPVFRWCFIFLLVAMLLVNLLQAELESSLPELEGIKAVSDIKQKVTIARDEQGTTFIRGNTDADAFFAVGYAHAQDRMWQLELQRRISSGRLSEVFGKNSLQEDIWFRTLGLIEASKKDWKLMNDAAKKSLQAYTAGINAWIEQSSDLPIEYRFFGFKPEPWSVYDSLAWAKVFSLNLSGNFTKEIERSLLHQYLSKKQIDFLYNVETDNDDVESETAYLNGRRKALAQILGVTKTLEDKYNIGGNYVGSNAWVVSGKHTATGNAMLANDPHLGLQLPSLWYALSIKGKRIDVSGMSIVGLPLVIFGRNKDISWGGTNMMADVQDLYVEQVNPENMNQYKTKEGWKNFKLRKEKIYISTEFPKFLNQEIKPIEIEIKESVNGPIISNVYNALDTHLALKWTSLHTRDSSYSALFELNYAHNWASFQEALSAYVAPALNMFYSDRKGNIGYLAVGKIPVRKGSDGEVPGLGWDPKQQWDGFIPLNDMPSSFNPAKGYIINANNSITLDSYPYFISSDWANPSRAERIKELLENRVKQNETIDLLYTQAMQQDLKDISGKEVALWLAQLEPKDARQKEALEYIASWDGDTSKSSQAQSILSTWMHFLRRAIFSDEVRGYWNKESESMFLQTSYINTDYRHIISILKNDRLEWCNDVNTDKVEACPEVFSKALNEALDLLTQLKGRDMSEWRWGGFLKLELSHNPFGSFKLLEPFFSRVYPTGGTPNTINVSNAVFVEHEGFKKSFGAGFRQIIDMGEKNTTHSFINSSGQSANIFSPHYDDVLIKFVDGGYNKIENNRNNFPFSLTLTPTEGSK